MRIEVPGYGTLEINNIVFDYNGTLAEGGELVPGAAILMNQLSEKLNLHVITADTFGTVERELEDVHCSIKVIDPLNQAEQKARFISSLGNNVTAAVGNGHNDRLMLKEACLGIALIQQEGAFTSTVLESDIICTSVTDAMKLFTEPKRLIATLRT